MGTEDQALAVTQKLIRQAVASGEVPPPRLLYTEAELREVRKLQAIAQVERDEIAPLHWQEGRRD